MRYLPKLLAGYAGHGLWSRHAVGVSKRVSCPAFVISVGLLMAQAAFCSESSAYRGLPLLKLIVDASPHYGKKVITTGYFEFSIFPTLYLNHLSAEVGDFDSGIRVRDDTEDGDIVKGCTGRYVTFWGLLSERNGSPELTELSKGIDPKTGETCWDRDL